MSTLQHILYYIAVPSTLVLIIQAILLLIGLGHDGAGVEFSDTSGLDLGDGSGADFSDPTDIPDAGDLSHDGGSVGEFATMNIFTIQGVITFLTVSSWVSIITVAANWFPVLGILFGIILGFAAMVGVAFAIHESRKLQQNGTLVMKNLLGATGTVYLVVPASSSGQGKVNVQMNERFVECTAVTDGEESIPTGASVRVVDVRGETVVVEKS